MTPQPDLIIGIDSSTTGCKAVVFDRHGTTLASGRAAHTLEMPQPGWHEQSAEHWWRALRRALRQALRGIDPTRLAGIAITHQRESFVPVDAAGQPLRNAIIWMDERAAGTLPDLERAIGRDKFHRLTGKPLSANLVPPKIAWLREHEPEVFARTAYYLDVHAFLVQRLTGQYRTGQGCADPTGLFDMAAQDWAWDLLAEIGVYPEQMPAAYPPGAILGHVTRAAARATGLPAGLPVMAGLGDGQAGGVGANICRPATAYLVLGTAVVTGTFSADYLTHPAFRTMSGGLPLTYLLETVLLGGTYTLEWLLKTFLGKQGAAAIRLRQELERDAAQIPPGSTGLVVVPYWNTVMNPYWDASASGIVAGWRGIHRPAHLYRAILEGIALELRLHFEGVEQATGRPVERVVAIGGGARSDLWCQIIADVTGKPLQRTAADETGALGAAILAAAGAGLYPSVDQAAQAMAAWLPEVFEPDAGRQRFYGELYEGVYRGMYPALREILYSLSLQERAG
jgi:xylulokinase